jgi:phosphoserine phosphatase
MISHKAKLISNDNLKRAGVALFLRGKSKEFLTKRGEEYSETVELNKVYYNEFLKYRNPYVVSASFYEYLSPLLPNSNLICSKMQYTNDRASGLKINCHGKTKYQALRALRIEHVNKLYTDSISDLALAQVSEEINLVRGDEIIRCDNLEHFVELAGR